MPLPFVDETRLEIYSGKGGDGGVSFRREKYVPNGGPDGGDGGDGGSVIFQIRYNLKTFSHLAGTHTFKAKSGQKGMGNRKHGKNGEDIRILIPPGTIVKDYESGEVLFDFDEENSEDGFEWTAQEGGKGGKGNWHYRSSRNQAPRYAQDGGEALYREIRLELSLIADIGFVGYPSAGKSTLLNALTNANSKTAPYPFTTKTPHLGILRRYEDDVVLADIPGIIEGASQGAGLGFRFLKHISRVKALAYLIDLSEETWETAYETLRNELGEYDASLLEKKHIIIGNKTDIEGTEEPLEKLREVHSDERVYAISALSGDGLDALIEAFFTLAE